MTEAVRLFCGYDVRQSAGWHAFAQSAMENCRLPLQLCPLGGSRVADASTEFTYARFHIPRLCGWQGWAIFMDGVDMLVREGADLADLWALRDHSKAVQVVQHDYTTRHPWKFVGTDMQSPNLDYPRKNWSSLIIWNCAAPEHGYLTPEVVDGAGRSQLHRFPWLADDRIGALPAEWNWLVDEFGRNALAKVLHWTAGNPGFKHYADAEYAAEWHAARARMGAQ